MPRRVVTPRNAGSPRAVSLGRSRSSAEIDLVGGGLRALTVDDVPLVETYDAGTVPPYAAGAVLFPWPNRVREGRWTHRGVEHQLALNDAPLGNANHGLVRDEHFTVLDQGDDHVTIRAVVRSQPGYPFTVALQLTYRLTDDGLTVDSLVTNESAEPAPVALGAHPYLRVGDVAVEDLVMQIPADAFLPLDRSLIPGEPEAVDGTALDWRTPRRIGSAELNACLVLGDDGSNLTRTVSVASPDGRVVHLWAGAGFGYVQIYTCPAFPAAGTPVTTRRALAVEPMSAPGDALNSGAGLRWLAPGADWRAAWGITARSGVLGTPAATCRGPE